MVTMQGGSYFSNITDTEKKKKNQWNARCLQKIYFFFYYERTDERSESVTVYMRKNIFFKRNKTIYLGRQLVKKDMKRQMYNNVKI